MTKPRRLHVVRMLTLTLSVPLLLVAFQNFSSSRATVRPYSAISSVIPKPLILCDNTRSQDGKQSSQKCEVQAKHIVVLNQHKLDDARGGMACVPTSYAMAFLTLQNAGYVAKDPAKGAAYQNLRGFHKLSPRDKAVRLADEMKTNAKTGTNDQNSLPAARALAGLYGQFSVIYQGVQWSGGNSTTFRPSYLRYRMARSELPIITVNRYVLETKTLISGKVAAKSNFQMSRQWGHAMYVKGFETKTTVAASDYNLVPDDSVTYNFQDPAQGLRSTKIVPMEVVPKNVFVALPGDLTPTTTFLFKERRTFTTGAVADTEKAGFYNGKPLFPVIALHYIQRADLEKY